MGNGEPKLMWDAEDPGTSLKKLRAYVEDEAAGLIGWYSKNVKRKRLAATWLRGLAILFTVLGGVIPLVKPVIGAWGTSSVAWLADLGYLLLGLAAAFVGVDRFWGASTAWIRFTMTQMALERELDKYRLEWNEIASRVSGVGDTEVLGMYFALSQKAVEQMHKLATDETRAWAQEFQSSLEALAQQGKK